MFSAELSSTARASLSELGSIPRIPATFFSSRMGSFRKSSYRTRQKSFLPARVRSQLKTLSSQQSIAIHIGNDVGGDKTIDKFIHRQVVAEAPHFNVEVVK